MERKGFWSSLLKATHPYSYGTAVYTRCNAWLEYGSWIKDFHAREDGSFVKPVAKVLKQLNLTQATIGIPGLLEQDRIMFPFGIFTALSAELPKANFKDATGLIESFRAVKSEEEIALMERSAEIGEAAIKTLAEVARPGILENQVIGAMFETMISEGAEIPIMWLYDAGRVRTGGGRLAFTRRRSPGERRPDLHGVQSEGSGLCFPF